MMQPMDEEAKQAIANAMAGDPTSDPLAEMQAQAGSWDMPSQGLPTASPDIVAQALQRNAAPSPSPMPTAMPQREAAPSDRGYGGDKSAFGDVDQGLAFFAAFSQNPVLQRMVEESRNRPRLEAEFARQQAQDQRAQEKWQQERDIMNPLKAGKLQNENALGAASLEGKQPGSAYSKAFRQNAYEQLMTHASRLGAAGLPGADQVQRMAQSIVQNESLSADAVERMMRGIPGMTDKTIADARAAAGQAETSRHNQATEALGYAQLKQRALNAANKHELMILKPQEKLNKEINELDQALVNMGEMAELKKDVNTGIYVDALAKFTNKWISSDLTSDKRKELDALTARVFNKETKTLAGSAVSESEWARIEPQIPLMKDDDSLFTTKLAKAIQIATDILQKRREEYQQKGGRPTDGSVTAQKNVRAQQNVGEKPMPAAAPAPTMKAPPGKAPGSLIRQKSTGKTFRVTQDGMLEEVR